MRAALLVVVGLTAVSAEALAGDNDFRLNATKNGQGVLFTQQNGRFVPDDALFRSLTTQLGYVFSPRIAAPADTIGYAGFQIGALWSGTFVSSDQPYWNVTERGQRDTPNRVLQTLQLEIRKGLPASFEVGTSFMWLAESKLFAPGLEVRWALQEGYHFSPDFGLRGSVNHLVGNRDLSLTVVGLDAVLSKEFGAFDLISLTPYLSWSVLMIAASSRVVDPTPGAEGDVDNNFVFRTIHPSDTLHHKLTVGMRALYYVLSLTVQGELQMIDGDRVFGSVATITTKLGLDY